MVRNVRFPSGYHFPALAREVSTETSSRSTPITRLAPNCKAAIENNPLPQPISKKDLSRTFSLPTKASRDWRACSNRSMVSVREKSLQFSPNEKAKRGLPFMNILSHCQEHRPYKEHGTVHCPIAH